MVWTMLWMILLHHVMNDAMNDPIKWWYEWCYERFYYMMLWTMLGMILLDDAMNDSVQIPKWIQLPTFPSLLDDAMNGAPTMLERCWANHKEYNYTVSHCMERCYEQCSNDAGQIPKKIIMQFHTAWNNAMNDAGMMLKRCWANPKEYNYALSHCMERCWNNAKTILGKSQMTAINAHKSHIQI